jgi:hypothetical protein
MAKVSVSKAVLFTFIVAMLSVAASVSAQLAPAPAPSMNTGTGFSLPAPGVIVGFSLMVLENNINHILGPHLTA